jgi:hypothetical protein
MIQPPGAAFGALVEVVQRDPLLDLYEIFRGSMKGLVQVRSSRRLRSVGVGAGVLQAEQRDRLLKAALDDVEGREVYFECGFEDGAADTAHGAHLGAEPLLQFPLGLEPGVSSGRCRGRFSPRP